MQEPGLTILVDVVSVHDGDTIKVRVSREFDIRVRGIDTPELKTVEGKEVQKIVENLITTADKIIVFIPSNDPLKLMDFNSFGRVVGDVYLDGKSLADIVRENKLQKKDINDGKSRKSV